MAEKELPPELFASVFAQFIRQVAATAHPNESALLGRIERHLGADPTQLPATTEQFDTFEAPNVQLAIDAYLREPGRSADLLGVSVENKRFLAAGLAELLVKSSHYMPTLQEGPVEYTNYHLANDEVLACVQYGLYLITAGDSRLVVLVMGPSDLGDPRRQRLRVEVMSARAGDGMALISELRDLMAKLNVYRGHTIVLAPGMQIGPGPAVLVQFQSIPKVVREQVVLPEGLLERIERHTVTFSQHADRLLEAGRSLKRGVLLFGLPGTGKTLTLMYLVDRMPDRTVILMTGRGLGQIEIVAKMARQLAPAMVVMEDVDLVAAERTMPGFNAGPILFELLNEMDGLRDDQDVIFVLTTNRADILEPALAARPGRIDLAVELPLPDAEARRRLIELYARGLSLNEVDLDSLIARIDGATPAYVKELLRKAALLAIEGGSGTALRQRDVDEALDELAQGGRLAERILGFRPDGSVTAGGPEVAVPSAEHRSSGFPPQVMFRKGT